MKTALMLWVLWAMWTRIYVLWFMICPPNPLGKLRTKWFIAGFDMWIGTYIDRPNKMAYWFPIPFVGQKFWREKE